MESMVGDLGCVTLCISFNGYELHGIVSSHMLQQYAHVVECLREAASLTDNPIRI